MEIQKTIKLLYHKTDGGAEYLTDNHNFAKAKYIIRIDELVDCLNNGLDIDTELIVR
jgi:hypothetical protein